MATIVNNPPAQSMDNGASAGGWAVAVIVILALVLVGLFMFGRYRANTIPSTANINVSLPNTGGGGSSGGSGGGGSSGGSGGGAASY
jgi:hypothetical protein